MDALTYLRANTFSLEQLVAAFNLSFEGYFVPMVQTVDSLRALIETNDVDLAHSFIAVDADGHPGGIVLLGIRGARGWIGGMGLAPQWRGQGRSAPLMQAALAEARALGLVSVELEVLAQNTPARSLYTRLGFNNIRSLAVFTGPLAEGATLTEGSSPLHEIPIERALTEVATLRQAQPTWQRDLPALRRMKSTLRAGGLLDGDTMRAIIVYMPSGLGFSIMDFGSHAPTPDGRRDDAVTLVRALIAPTPGAPLRAINVPPGDPLGDALVALGCPMPHTQWEMKLELA